MTRVKLKDAIQEIGGILYEVELNRSGQEEGIVIEHPYEPHGKSSEAQKAHRQHFKEAVAYAKAAMADPDMWAIYEKRAAKEHSIPYRVALSDYLKRAILRIDS